MLSKVQLIKSIVDCPILFNLKLIILKLIIQTNNFHLMQKQQQQPTQTMLRISDFISIATQLAFSASQIIKQGSENTELQKYSKGHDDPVTEADYHVQTMIIGGLRKFFPELRVVGEETVDYKGKIAVDYECLTLESFPQNAKFKELQVPINELCVWIDPIDCTKGFIRKQMHLVTTLIGMARNQSAYLGIIGIPYKQIHNKTIYRPQVLIGVSQTHQAYRFSTQTKWTPILPHPTSNPPKVITTNSRVADKYKKLVAHVKGQHLLGDGSGFKLVALINGDADMFVYLSHHTSKWDTCAGEAIIKALGGMTLTMKEEEIVYDPELEDHHNNFGVISSLDHELIKKAFEFLNS